MGSGQQATIDTQRIQLAEQEGTLRELESEKEDVTDIFFTQEATIQSLTDLIKVQDQEVAYVNPPAPAPARPNYILYAALGLGALIIFKKVKL